MSRQSAQYRAALYLVHILNAFVVGAVTYFVARYVVGVERNDSGACAVLNGALCYFERDASERIADAILRICPGVPSPVGPLNPPASLPTDPTARQRATDAIALDTPPVDNEGPFPRYDGDRSQHSDAGNSGA